MYSEEIISKLTNRIGFGTPKEEGFTIEIDEANSIGESGRKFSSFHALVTVENMFAALPDLDGDDADEKFNSILEEYRSDAVLAILPLILDEQPNYVASFNYDSLVEDNIKLFDSAIGYKGAIMILEMMLSTKESNLAERGVKLSAANLKLELEGFKNESGHLVASGLSQTFNKSISAVVKKMFPKEIVVQKGKPW